MDDYQNTILRWREARAARLTAPTGWLSLVDRIILAEGANELPFGTVTLERGIAHLTIGPGAAVTTPNGSPVTDRVWRPNESGPVDALHFEGRIYELFKRADAFAVRVRDPQAASRVNFPGIEYFPIDPALRIVARFERYDPARTTVHEFDVGPGVQRQIPGVARFSIDGREFALEPVIEPSSNRLYLIFGDQTNGVETYPSGRFLYADIPSGDEVVLDFNMAFNPPCAFTEFSTCPLTPAANRLKVRIAAGERYRGGGAAQ